LGLERRWLGRRRLGRRWLLWRLDRHLLWRRLGRVRVWWLLRLERRQLEERPLEQRQLE
jgi:hypothetical protein